MAQEVLHNTRLAQFLATPPEQYPNCLPHDGAMLYPNELTCDSVETMKQDQ